MSETLSIAEVTTALQFRANLPETCATDSYLMLRASALLARSTSTDAGAFQWRVKPWMMACFGEQISSDRVERNHRFLEEALELVQSLGCTQSESHQLVDYVFGRERGEPVQEAGGVMVTLAALCLANDLDMDAAGETELARIWTKVDKIRAKQAAKPAHSPLPACPSLQGGAEPAQNCEHCHGTGQPNGIMGGPEHGLCSHCGGSGTHSIGETGGTETGETLASLRAELGEELSRNDVLIEEAARQFNRATDAESSLAAEKLKVAELEAKFEVSNTALLDMHSLAKGLEQRVAALVGLAHFFASVIKSGEPWTETCQTAYNAAMPETAAAGGKS